MIESLDTDRLMTGPLGYWLRDSAADRRRALWRCIALIVGGIAIAVFFLSVFIAPLATHSIYVRAFIPGSNFFRTAIVMAGIFGGMIVMWRGFSARRRALNLLKQQINGEIAAALDIRYSAIGKYGPDFGEPIDYKILPDYDFSQREDSWSGEWRRHPFSLVEAELSTEGHGENNSRKTVFKGIVAHIGNLAEAPGVVVVRQRKWLGNFFGRSKNWGGHALESLKLDDTPFANEFDIVASDPDAARAMLTPEFRKLLLDLERSQDADRLNTLFIRDEIYVTMRTPNLFESASFNPSNDRKRIARTIDQFRTIVRVIESIAAPHRRPDSRSVPPRD